MMVLHIRAACSRFCCLWIFAVPSAAPEDVAVEVMNGSLVKVSWTRVHKDKMHGHLGGYRVIPQKQMLALRHSLKGMTLTWLCVSEGHLHVHVCMICKGLSPSWCR